MLSVSDKKKVFSDMLRILQDRECVISDSDCNYSLKELETTYNYTLEQQEKYNMCKKLNELMTNGYLSYYDNSKSLVELTSLYHNICICYMTFKELCDIHHLPVNKLYTHVNYLEFLNTLYSCYDHDITTAILNYFNMVFNMHISKEHLLFVMGITSVKTLLNKRFI